MVDYPIGELIAERVRAMGVTPVLQALQARRRARAEHGHRLQRPRHGVRAPVVFYNRSNEAAAQLKPGDFDWKAIFGGGVRWFHSGGIFAALSETTAELIIEGMQAAKTQRRRRVVRPELPREAVERLRRRPQRARSTCSARIVEHVDVLVGNEEDLQKGLGIPGPGGRRQVEARSERFFGMIDRVVAQAIRT